jgi:hypothetical protein
MPPRPWTVLPHGPLEDLQPNLKGVRGSLPHGRLGRYMSVARLTDGRLAFYNAVPLGEPDMQRLEAWGTPAILYVPNRFHRLDLHAFKQRYPELKLFCSQGARARVEQAAPVDGTQDELPSSGEVEVQWIPLRGTKADEAVMQVRFGTQTTLCFGDAVMNIPHLGGFEGLVLRLLGSSGVPKVTFIAKLALVKSKAELADHLRELATLPGLTRLVPTHGDIIDTDAPAVLRKIADVLHRPTAVS